MKAMVLGAAVALWLGLAGGASADTAIFNDLGPGDSVYTHAIWAYSGPDTEYGADTPEVAFVSPGNFSVTELDLGLGWLGGTNTATVGLHIPGDPDFVTWDLSDVAPCCGGAITAITGITGVTLSAGQTYFLDVLAGTDGTSGGWYYNDTNTYAFVADPAIGYGANDVAPAFAMFGTSINAVPEPSTLALFASGLAVLFVGYRRRSRA